MKKVYCKDCKFNKSIPLVEWTTCEPFVRKSRKDDYYCKNHKVHKIMRKIEYMHELNEDNDCIYYKRKWWKFWRIK